MTWSTCWPQPAQVVFPQTLHATDRHIPGHLPLSGSAPTLPLPVGLSRVAAAPGEVPTLERTQHRGLRTRPTATHTVHPRTGIDLRSVARLTVSLRADGAHVNSSDLTSCQHLYGKWRPDNPERPNTEWSLHLRVGRCRQQLGHRAVPRSAKRVSSAPTTDSSTGPSTRPGSRDSPPPVKEAAEQPTTSAPAPTAGPATQAARPRRASSPARSISRCSPGSPARPPPTGWRGWQPRGTTRPDSVLSGTSGGLSYSLEGHSLTMAGPSAYSQAFGLVEAAPDSVSLVGCEGVFETRRADGTCGADRLCGIGLVGGRFVAPDREEQFCVDVSAHGAFGP